jgi:competence protein ComEC
MLSEAAGHDGEPLPIDALMQARCSNDLCIAGMNAGGRRWRVLATRSPYRLDWQRLTRLCASVDIAISERRLPRGCTPRWLKLDGPMLRRTGGVAVDLDGPRVDTVAAHVGRHPWSMFR